MSYLESTLMRDVPSHSVAKNFPDVFGLEIELEGRGVIADPDDFGDIYKYWVTHADNSLRNIREDSENIEYVFGKPLNYADTVQGLRVLLDYLNSDKAEVFESYRTSIHVHINCVRETYRTIYNFMTLAILFDDMFVSRNGDHRVGNNFCLRARDAQAQVFDLATSIKRNQSIWQLNSNHRYSSVNFVSLMKFGTIEFRSLECTTDFGRVKHWIDTCQALKVSARNFVNPREIISSFSMGTPEEFMVKILGPQAPYYMKSPDWKDKLKDGMRLAQDLAYCSDWVEKAGEQSAAPKVRGKKAIPNGPNEWAELVFNQMNAAQPQQAGIPNPIWAINPIPEPNLAVEAVVEVDDEDDLIEQLLGDDEDDND